MPPFLPFILIVVVAGPPWRLNLGPDPTNATPAQLRVILAAQLSIPHAAGHPMHDKALDWLHVRSRNIVQKVDAFEFDPRAVSMRYWSPDGLLRFYEDFVERFPQIADQVYVYARWHDAFLMYEAKRAGVWQRRFTVSTPTPIE